MHVGFPSWLLWTFHLPVWVTVVVTLWEIETGLHSTSLEDFSVIMGFYDFSDCTAAVFYVAT